MLCTFSHLPYSSTASLTGATETLLFHSFKWDSTSVVVADELCMCCSVSICDRHRPTGNVGHILMHNNSLQLHSHPQIGRLSPMFWFFSWKKPCFVYLVLHLMQPLLTNNVHMPPPPPHQTTVAVAPILSLILCSWENTIICLSADNNSRFLKSPLIGGSSHELFTPNVSWCFVSGLSSSPDNNWHVGLLPISRLCWSDSTNTPSIDVLVNLGWLVETKEVQMRVSSYKIWHSRSQINH